jgi:hypothetical protein
MAIVSRQRREAKLDTSRTSPSTFASSRYGLLVILVMNTERPSLWPQHLWPATPFLQQTPGFGPLRIDCNATEPTSDSGACPDYYGSDLGE